ncbi:hypothetical protein BDQ17DRAFT_1432992 [Cyathus striatus]|nr:hypothetical protein BDQ17DRAFT_1432992 [Cyathus striatus]
MPRMSANTPSSLSSMTSERKHSMSSPPCHEQEGDDESGGNKEKEEEEEEEEEEDVIEVSEKGTGKGKKISQKPIPKGQRKKVKKSSVQCLQEDQELDAQGVPAHLTSNLTVAPPPQLRGHSGTVLPPHVRTSTSSRSGSSGSAFSGSIKSTSGDSLNEKELSIFSGSKSTGNTSMSKSSELLSKGSTSIEDDNDDAEEMDIDKTPKKSNKRHNHSTSPTSPTVSIDSCSSKSSRKSLSHSTASSHSSTLNYLTGLESNLIREDQTFESFMSQFNDQHSDEVDSDEEDSVAKAVDSLALQGASKITGGHMCEHALGNNFNFGDAEERDVIPVEVSTTGTVHVFSNRKSTEAHFAIKNVKLHYKLGKVVHIGPYMFIWEDNTWVIKGHYSELLKDLEDIEWFVNEKNNTVCHVLAEGLDSSAISAPAVTMSTPVASGSGSSKALRSVTKEQQQIIDIFKIPPALRYEGTVSIHVVYAKWLFIQKIVLELPGKIADGSFTGKKVVMSEHTLYFLQHHPTSGMEQWFMGDPNIKDEDVWGARKPGIDYLGEILNKHITIAEQKKKEEEKEEREKEKEKEKEKDKNKGKGKEKRKESRKGKE